MRNEGCSSCYQFLSVEPPPPSVATLRLRIREFLKPLVDDPLRHLRLAVVTSGGTDAPLEVIFFEFGLRMVRVCNSGRFSSLPVFVWC